MKIALIGYGKMGKAVEQIALSRGHEINLIIDENNIEAFNPDNLKNSDLAIEFTNPHAAVKNYYTCFNANIPVVSGTTGWTNQLPEIIQYCNTHQKTLFYASNFSAGVHAFFNINKHLAKLMEQFNNYVIKLTETHHTQKLDAPSGTAISLANDIINCSTKYNGWTMDVNNTANQIPVTALREPNVIGTHTIEYESEVDKISITHFAKNRTGLALGAVLAAEYALGKKGFLTMEQMLNFG